MRGWYEKTAIGLHGSAGSYRHFRLRILLFRPVDVTINKDLLKCDGTQRTYLAGVATAGRMTAVCSAENTSGPAISTAKWVAGFHEKASGTTSSYGQDCYFHQASDMRKWRCKTWTKDVEVEIKPVNCINFDEADDYVNTEQ